MWEIIKVTQHILFNLFPQVLLKSQNSSTSTHLFPPAYIIKTHCHYIGSSVWWWGQHFFYSYKTQHYFFHSFLRVLNSLVFFFFFRLYIALNTWWEGFISMCQTQCMLHWPTHRPLIMWSCGLTAFPEHCASIGIVFPQLITSNNQQAYGLPSCQLRLRGIWMLFVVRLLVKLINW